METIVDELKKRIARQADLAGVYGQSVRFVADRVEARAVIIWNCSSPPFHPICEINRTESDTVSVGLSQERHLDLMQRAVNQFGVVTSKGETDSDGAGNSLLLLCRVQRNDEYDLIEVFLPADRSVGEIEKNKAELQQCAEAISEALAAETFESETLTETATITGDDPHWQGLQQVTPFLQNLHRSLDLRETCVHIANEAQSLLECDRVTVCRFDGRKSRITAVSGMPKVNRRANTLAALERLATATLRMGEPFWYPEGMDELPPQISEPLDRYLAEGVTRSMVIVPIRNKEGDTRLSPEEIRFDKSEPVIGGLVLENFSGVWQQSQFEDPIRFVSRHASTAYRNAYSHQGLFLYPLWAVLGSWKRFLFSPRYFPRTMMAVLALIAVVASLFLIPRPAVGFWNRSLVAEKPPAGVRTG